MVILLKGRKNHKEPKERAKRPSSSGRWFFVKKVHDTKESLFDYRIRVMVPLNTYTIFCLQEWILCGSIKKRRHLHASKKSKSATFNERVSWLEKNKQQRPVASFGRYSQVVRQRIANPLFPSSNLGTACCKLALARAANGPVQSGMIANLMVLRIRPPMIPQLTSQRNKPIHSISRLNTEDKHLL